MENKVLFVVSRVNDCDYRADRRTPLGNPIKMFNEDQRDLVCDQYEVFFNDKIIDFDPTYIFWLRDIKYKAMLSKKPIFKIGCHCAPKRCHVDTIVRFLNNYGNSI